MFQELRTGLTRETIRNPTGCFPSPEIDFKDFPGELEDWNTRSRVHQAQFPALGCVGVLTAKGEDDIKIGSSDIDADDIHPDQLRAAHRPGDR